MSVTEIYKQSADYALQSGEIDRYRESAEISLKCANAIDEAIHACNYELHRYKMSEAVKSVVDTFGFERVNWVLAATIHQQHYDGRYSTNNQKWAREFGIPDERYPGFLIHTHPAVLDGFINSVRKAHREMLAEVIRSYEQSHHMADRNRLTWFHNDFGTFVPKQGVTEQRLSEHYSEIMEKKSVLDKIRVARKEQKQPSAPKPEREKKQGAEL